MWGATAGRGTAARARDLPARLDPGRGSRPPAPRPAGQRTGLGSGRGGAGHASTAAPDLLRPGRGSELLGWGRAAAADPCYVGVVRGRAAHADSRAAAAGAAAGPDIGPDHDCVRDGRPARPTGLSPPA